MVYSDPHGADSDLKGSGLAKKNKLWARGPREIDKYIEKPLVKPLTVSRLNIKDFLSKVSSLPLKVGIDFRIIIFFIKMLLDLFCCRFKN